MPKMPHRATPCPENPACSTLPHTLLVRLFNDHPAHCLRVAALYSALLHKFSPTLSIGAQLSIPCVRAQQPSRSEPSHSALIWDRPRRSSRQDSQKQVITFEMCSYAHRKKFTVCTT